MVKAYCFKDKKQVDVQDPEYGLNKINRAVVKGKCPVCKGKVTKFLKHSEIPPNLLSKMEKKGKGRSKRSHKSKR